MELKGGAIGIQGRIAVCGCLCLGGPLRLSILLIGRYGASGGRYAAAPAAAPMFLAVSSRTLTPLPHWYS